MTPERLIAWRYLRARHAYGFISLIGYLGIVGLAIGVAALVLTLSVMSGFQEAVEDKVAALDGHLRLASAYGQGSALPDSVLEWLRRDPAVAAVTPFIAQHALVRRGRKSDGVLLLGADWAQLREVLEIETYIIAGSLPSGGEAPLIVIGAKLAATLNAAPGDQLYLFDIDYLLGQQGLRGQEFTVAATYRSGMAEYDRLLAFTALPPAEALFGTEGAPIQAMVNLRQRDRAEELAATWEAELGFPYYFITWRQRHAALFSWLTGQQVPILVIFGFIALVAVVNIFSTLMLIVVEKQRDIGILRSMGFSRRRIQRIFMSQGGVVGLVGTGAGMALALILGYIQVKYQILALDPDIYFMDALPVKWTWQALAAIPALAIILSLAAALWPARRAARVQPAEALRYE